MQRAQGPRRLARKRISLVAAAAGEGDSLSRVWRLVASDGVPRGDTAQALSGRQAPCGTNRAAVVQSELSH